MSICTVKLTAKTAWWLPAAACLMALAARCGLKPSDALIARLFRAAVKVKVE